MFTRFKVILFLSIFAAMLTPTVFCSAKSVNLDAATVSKGYTVIADMEIGILPGVLSEPSRVKIENYSGELPVARNAELISDVYLYDISMTNPEVLVNPITIKIPFDSENLKNKQIYVWHREKKAWQSIPTDVNEDQNYARAFVHFPFSIVAVFEGEGSDISRISESDFTGFSAGSVLAIDARAGTVLYQQDAGVKRSLASLTKLMTAQVFLNNNPGWDKEVMYLGSDNVGGASVDLRPGEVASVRDLFWTMLVGSKNNATKALVRSTGLSDSEFVAKMNAQAAEWGLTQTWFVEPTGLSAHNVTSARDYARLSQRVLQSPEVVQASTSANYTLRTKNTGRIISIRNTNRLAESSRYYLTGGKTGFTYEAGYCLMTRLRPEQNPGSEIIIVIMGDSGYSNLFNHTEMLSEWVYRTFNWNN